MQAPGALFIISLLIIPTSLIAQLPCSAPDINNARKNALSTDISAEQRVALMEVNRKIIQRIQQERNKDLPRSYYNNCKQSYEEVYVTLFNNAPNNAKSRADFKESVGDFFAFREELSNALLFYDDAIKITPQNVELHIKAWRVFYNIESRKLMAMNQSERDKHLPTYRRESIRRIDEIAKQKSSDNVSVAEILLGKADLYILEGKWQEGLKVLDEVLAKMPMNQEALSLSARTSLKFKMYEQARPKLEKLLKFPSTERWAYEELAKISLQSENLNGLVEISNRALNRYPEDSLFLIYKGISLVQNNRIEEAQDLLKRLTKIKNKPKELVVRFSALLLEAMGDRELGRGKVSHAIVYYRKAILQSTESRHIRSKTALAILNYARSKKFTPAEVIAQDMDFALDYVVPLTQEPVVSEDLLLDIIEICSHSNKKSLGPTLCDRYQKDFSTFKSFDGLLNCSNLYLLSGQKNAARNLLESGLKSPKFSAFHPQLMKELQKIGI